MNYDDDGDEEEEEEEEQEEEEGEEEEEEEKEEEEKEEEEEEEIVKKMLMVKKMMKILQMKKIDFVGVTSSILKISHVNVTHQIFTLQDCFALTTGLYLTALTRKQKEEGAYIDPIYHNKHRLANTSPCAAT